MAVSFLSDALVRNYSIPSSCIESAEYIIQCIASDRILRWKSGCANIPHVYATFGDGVQFNISNTPNFHDEEKVIGLKDYNFLKPAVVGQGLILLNKLREDSSTYNMHLGAIVLRKSETLTYISDVSEGKSVSMISDWKFSVITSHAGFRGKDYPAEKFALGLLHIL